MTTPTFADLAQYGIVNKPVSEIPDHDALADAFVDAVFDELELEIPDEPTEQDIEDINIILEHAAMHLSSELTASEWMAQWGKKGMKWGERKIDLNKNGIEDSLEGLSKEYAIGEEILNENDVLALIELGYDIRVMNDGKGWFVKDGPKAPKARPDRGMTREEILNEYKKGAVVGLREAYQASDRGWEIKSLPANKDGENLFKIVKEPTLRTGPTQGPTVKLDMTKKTDTSRPVAVGDKNRTGGIFNELAKLDVDFKQKSATDKKYVDAKSPTTGTDIVKEVDNDTKVVVSEATKERDKKRKTASKTIAHSAMTLHTDLELSEFLAQWGVLGMKWGRRKNREGRYEYNARRQAGNHPGHGEGGEKLGNENRPKSVREMTDSELNAVINRHRLEQQYNQIMAAKPNALTEFTKTVLKDAAKKQATAYASKAIGAVGDIAIKAVNEQLKKQKAKK